MFRTPIEYAPWRPVSLVPARIGISLPVSESPIRRLKKRRVSPDPFWRPPPPPPPPPAAKPPPPAPNRKIPEFSRKKSRFSGKNRLKRDRLICCSSASACEKSVLTVKSQVSPLVTPYFTSNPASKSPSVPSRPTVLELLSA